MSTQEQEINERREAGGEMGLGLKESVMAQKLAEKLRSESPGDILLEMSEGTLGGVEISPENRNLFLERNLPALWIMLVLSLT